MSSATSGYGLRDIDRILFRVGESGLKKLEVLARRKYTTNLGFSVCKVGRAFPIVAGSMLSHAELGPNSSGRRTSIITGIISSF